MPPQLLTDLTQKNNVVSRHIHGYIRKTLEKAAATKLKKFRRHLKNNSVLDIGQGAGAMYQILQDYGYHVSGLDVTNSSLYSHTAKLYDGEHFPYKSKEFDTGLLICVLHHCVDQEQVLREATRTCKRLIIIEDTYRTPLEKTLVSWRDQIGNLEFYGHEYRQTRAWQKLFQKYSWRIIHAEEWSDISTYGMYGRQTLFVVETE